MTPHQVSAEQAEAQANFLRQYWDSYGGKVLVTTSVDRLCGFSVRMNLGPDGLPKRWEKPGQRTAYIKSMRHGWPQLLAYINREILPVHNRMGSPLDS